MYSKCFHETEARTDAGKSTKQDIEFMRESVAAELETVPVGAHLILILGGIFVLTVILWASFATLDEIAHAEESHPFHASSVWFKIWREAYLRT